jgi:phosphatidylserine/phosphatidylglycerophosphate/cardiolipin synthase-like enzyme
VSTDFVRAPRSIALSLIAGRGHYDAVIEAVMTATRSVWIATANLKELMVEDPRARPGQRRTMKRRRSFRSVIGVFEELVGRGVELRLLHAGEPSQPFQEELRRRRGLTGGKRRAKGAGVVVPGAGSFEMRRCPRVHFKMVVIDGARLYLGSANWTGAGLGAKGEGRRNFELGFMSGDDLLLDEAQGLFDHVWRGAPCAACKLRDRCEAPLDGLGVKPPAPTVPR